MAPPADGAASGGWLAGVGNGLGRAPVVAQPTLETTRMATPVMSPSALTISLLDVYGRARLTPQQSSGRISSSLARAYIKRTWNRRFS
jgi:hypothetical protein